MSLNEKYVSSLAAGGGTGSSAASPYTWAEMLTEINGGSAAGNRYNVKADGTYSIGSTSTLTSGGSSTSPVIIRGYNSTIGDGYLGRTNSNGPLIATNMPLVSYSSGTRLSLSTWTILECLQVAASINVAAVGMSNFSAALRCAVTNATSSVGAVGIDVGFAGLAFDNDASLTGTASSFAAIRANGAGARVIANRLTAAAAVGLSIGQTVAAIGNTIYGCGSHGIAATSTSQPATIVANTIVGCAGDGINLVTGSTTQHVVATNLITDNTGYGINGVSAANAAIAAYNRLDRNTAGATNLATDWIAATAYGRNATSVLQAAEYVGYGSQDFRLQSTSPAKAAGLPSYMDIGALQRQEAGGGGILRPARMTGGFHRT